MSTKAVIVIVIAIYKYLHQKFFLLHEKAQIIEFCLEIYKVCGEDRPPGCFKFGLKTATSAQSKLSAAENYYTK